MYASILSTLTKGGSGCIDLDDAYHCGNEIELIAQAAGSGIVSEQQKVQHTPVLLKQTTPGAGNLAGYGLLNAVEDASLRADGFSLTPKNKNTVATTAMGPGFLAMQGSGLPTQQVANLILQVGHGSFGGNFAALSASGVLIVSSNGALVLNQNGGTGPLLIENKGNGQGEGGQLTLSAFNGSGQLEYRMGTNEAWHWKPSYELSGGPGGDGFHPIPHSGQVQAMILMTLKRFGLI